MSTWGYKNILSDPRITNTTVVKTAGAAVALVVAQMEFGSAAPSGPTMALAATEGADTASGTLALAISLSMASAEGADVLAATVGLRMSLAMAVTEGADTASVAVGLRMSLALAATEGADTASGAVGLAVTLSMAVTEGADSLAAAVTVVAGASDLALSVTEGADLCSVTVTIDIPTSPPVAPAPTPDRFQAAPLAGGVVGRLAIDRPLVDYATDIIISISGLGSESIVLYAEGVNGKKVDDVPIHYLKTGAKLPDSRIQNGVFVIKSDDLKATWDNIAFQKSGNSDRFILTIESPFDYVERSPK